tara:strand:+ start:491 stop:1462 length:972 start_codon:yes stop_codon:yes gene_type:complete
MIILALALLLNLAPITLFADVVVMPYKLKASHLQKKVKSSKKDTLYNLNLRTYRYNRSLTPNTDKSLTNSRNAIITGVAKNIAGSITNMEQNIENIKKAFDKTITIIVIDDNQDNTETLLRDYAKNTTDTLIYKIANKGHRTERIANARNKALDEAEKYLDEYNYLVNLDLDHRSVSTESISNAINDEKKWSIITANTNSYYYDRWALRTESYSTSCWEKNDNSCGQRLSRWFPDTKLNAIIPPSSPPLSVISAFGGMAIYKTKTLKTCRKYSDCIYDGHCDGGKQCSYNQNMDCEHVHFHKKLTRYTGESVLIWPSLTIVHI